MKSTNNLALFTQGIDDLITPQNRCSNSVGLARKSHSFKVFVNLRVGIIGYFFGLRSLFSRLAQGNHRVNQGNLKLKTTFHQSKSREFMGLSKLEIEVQITQRETHNC